MSAEFPPAMKHNALEQVFNDIYMVTGAMEMGPGFKFSRNMYVIRQGEELTLVNTVRLDEQGLATLDALGKVTHIFRIGTFHDRDDAFYKDRYGAKCWSVKPVEITDEVLTQDSLLPIGNAKIFQFHTSKQPEALLHLDWYDGIVISCDALQNFTRTDDGFFNLRAKIMMRFMGFIKAANIGPAWRKRMKVEASDFEAMTALKFDAVLPAHGAPIKHGAKQAYGQTIESIYKIET